MCIVFWFENLKGIDHLEDCRWEGNIRIDLREIRWEGVNWIHLAQIGDRWRALLNTVTNHWVP